MKTSTTAPGREARTVTITWGAALLVVAGLVLADQLVTLTIDPVLVALGLLVGVGIALVTGGLLSLRGRTADEPGRDPGSVGPDGEYTGDLGDSFHGGVDKGSGTDRY